MNGGNIIVFFLPITSDIGPIISTMKRAGRSAESGNTDIHFAVSDWTLFSICGYEEMWEQTVELYLRPQTLCCMSCGKTSALNEKMNAVIP